MCISNVTKIKNIQNIQVMANQNKTDIGLIGLAVMGENLALNMESKGWHVSVYNRTVPGVEEGVVERFLNGRHLFFRRLSGENGSMVQAPRCASRVCADGQRL